MNEKPNLYEPMKDSYNPKASKGKGKTLAIVVLVILLLGSVGYIVYDKFIKEDVKETEVKKDEPKKEVTTKIMRQEEAINLGKTMYEKTRDIYQFPFSAIKLSNEKYDREALDSITPKVIVKDTGLSKITNLNEIKNYFTESMYNSWINDKNSPIYSDNNGNYYINTEGGGNPVYYKNKYQITINKIYEDIITYNIKEFFCGDENDLSQCSENGNLKAEEVVFELKLEEGKWKVNSYIDANVKHNTNY